MHRGFIEGAAKVASPPRVDFVGGPFDGFRMEVESEPETVTLGTGDDRIVYAIYWFMSRRFGMPADWDVTFVENEVTVPFKADAVVAARTTAITALISICRQGNMDALEPTFAVILEPKELGLVTVFVTGMARTSPDSVQRLSRPNPRVN